jgi:signal transduction histidine kinase
MSFSEQHKFPAHVINNLTVGIWEYNIAAKTVLWSAGFYTSLSYTPGEIECSYNYFLEELLYPGDKDIFLKTTRLASESATPAVQIRLLTKDRGYEWFESSVQRLDTENGPLLLGILTNINTYKLLELKAAKNEFLCAETGRIAKIGGWEIETSTMALMLTKEIYDIYELKEYTDLSVEDAISFFEPPYRPMLIEAVDNAIRYCTPYDIELLFRSAKNNLIWVRVKGIPVLDDEGNCITVRGIFQDIDSIKKNGINLQSSINLLDDQNKRLQNFAYIVSHNLRSHAGNLKFMVNLFEETQLKDDKLEIFSHIKTISESLSATMGHLDDIVKIQSEISRERKPVSFQNIYNNVTLALKANITATNATIKTDFSKAEQINYIPAYLESIFQNLITNALKYKHPNRNPVITCYTQQAGNNIYLVFEDNGIGIDLERYGADVFGMYKTFHQNTDAKGIGLFITRNQVEALGGSIHVESTVNVGTKFTVKLV